MKGDAGGGNRAEGGKAGGREACVCNGDRAAYRRAFSRNGTAAHRAQGAHCSGKAICHCINLY
jgi:hypothetical protein